MIKFLRKEEREKKRNERDRGKERKDGKEREVKKERKENWWGGILRKKKNV